MPSSAPFDPGLSYSEVADRLGCSQQAAGAHASRGLKHLGHVVDRRELFRAEVPTPMTDPMRPDRLDHAFSEGTREQILATPADEAAPVAPRSRCPRG